MNDPTDKIEARRVLRRVAPMLRQYKKGIALGMLFVLVYTATLLAGPLIVRYAIDNGLTPGDPDALWLAVVAYAIVAAVGFVAFRAQILTVARVGENFLRDLRIRVFDHLQSLPLGFYEGERAGTLVSRMTSDIDAVRQLVEGTLFDFVRTVLLLVLSFAVLLWMSPMLTLLCAIGAPPIIIASVWFRRRSSGAWLGVRDRTADTLSAVQEGVAGVRVIQSFTREKAAVAGFRKHNDGLLSAYKGAIGVNIRYFPIVEAAGVVATAVVLVVGGGMVVGGAITIGTVAAFVLYLRNLFDPVEELSFIYSDIQQAGAALTRIFGLLDEKPNLEEKKNAAELPERATLSAENVGFHYGSGPEVLHNVSLAVEVGETLALVGATGAGKSTLAKLLARFYDPTEGRVRFGDADLRDARFDSLRPRIILVPQEGHLFNDTVRDNIRFGRPGAGDAEIEATLHSLGIHERFDKLPDGLDTSVEARGSRLSAGEKQLVSLARAALADPAVLILDEATSSLDPGTEALVGRAMERLMLGRTVILIAHRLTTAARADRVAVMEGGRLVEAGPHEELLRRRGRYAALWKSWRGGASRVVGIGREDGTNIERKETP